MVIRPQDGPGSWERRQQLADELAAKIGPKSYGEQPTRITGVSTLKYTEFRDKALELLAISSRGAKALADLVRCSESSAFGHCRKMEALGLITRRNVRWSGTGVRTFIDITDEGRALFESLDQ